MKKYGLCLLLILGLFNVITAQSTDENRIVDIDWSPDSTRIAVAYRDASIAIFNVNDIDNPIRSFQTDMTTEIHWTPDSKYVVTQGTAFEEPSHLQMSASKWDATTGELVETLMSFEFDTIYDFNPYGYIVFPILAFDTELEHTAFSLNDASVLISDGLNVLHIEDPSTSSNVRYMEWGTNNEKIAVVYGSTDIYSIQVFDVESGDLLQRIVQDFQYFITDLSWDATETYLATSSMSLTCCEVWANIGVYQIGSTEGTLRYQADHWWWEVNTSPAPIEWHPTELILAIGTENSIDIYDISLEDPIFVVDNIHAFDIAWSPDSHQIAGALQDGTIEIWDINFMDS